RLGAVLLEAHRLGCKFDGWSEFFDLSVWRQAFENCGVDPSFYANRRRDYDEILPWDHIDCGIDKRFLIAEHKKAMNAETTPNCREKCSGCGAARLTGGKCSVLG
ncbi:MAG: B12-binding domain-containing radical SAM protein, partial [Clostridia bacterium]|nr:B12-binding domain-containing radical SAM protein [Clostridia bacterium]